MNKTLPGQLGSLLGARPWRPQRPAEHADPGRKRLRGVVTTRYKKENDRQGGGKSHQHNDCDLPCESVGGLLVIPQRRSHAEINKAQFTVGDLAVQTRRELVRRANPHTRRLPAGWEAAANAAPAPSKEFTGHPSILAPTLEPRALPESPGRWRPCPQTPSRGPARSMGAQEGQTLSVTPISSRPRELSVWQAP